MRTETWYIIAIILGITNIIVSLWTKAEYMYIVTSIAFIWAFCLAIFWEARYNEVQEKMTELQYDNYKPTTTDDQFHSEMKTTDPICVCLHRQSQHMSMGTCGEPNCSCTHFHTHISLKEKTHDT